MYFIDLKVIHSPHFSVLEVENIPNIKTKCECKANSFIIYSFFMNICVQNRVKE